MSVSLSLADPRGRPGTYSPSPNSFIFMQFSAKHLQNNKLAHTLWEFGVPIKKILDLALPLFMTGGGGVPKQDCGPGPLPLPWVLPQPQPFPPPRYIFKHVHFVTHTIGGSRGGVRDARPPWASKFFRFHAVFGKIWRVHAPPGGFTPPPRENPGSATAYCQQVGRCLQTEMLSCSDIILKYTVYIAAAGKLTTI